MTDTAAARTIWPNNKTQEGRLATLMELERIQMTFPRGPDVWPNMPIQAIAHAADAIVGLAPEGSPEHAEMMDAFTWGLDEIDT